MIVLCPVPLPTRDHAMGDAMDAMREMPSQRVSAVVRRCAKRDVGVHVLICIYCVFLIDTTRPTENSA